MRVFFWQRSAPGPLVLSVGTFSWWAAWLRSDDLSRARHYVHLLRRDRGHGHGNFFQSERRRQGNDQGRGKASSKRAVAAQAAAASHVPLAGCQRRFTPFALALSTSNPAPASVVARDDSTTQGDFPDVFMHRPSFASSRAEERWRCDFT